MLLGLLAALSGCSSIGTPPRHMSQGGEAGSGASAGSAGLLIVGAGGSFGGSAAAGEGPIIRVDSGTHGMGCNDIRVGFEKIIPTVVLLVDESGSMADNKYPSGGTQSRWRVLHDALLASGGLVEKLAQDVRFGFMGYTGDGNAANCPILTRTMIYPVSSDGAALTAIRSTYPEERPNLPYSGETPTGVSLRAATQTLLDYKESGPKNIVLATDGDPDTCARPNPQCGQEEAITAAQDAFTSGVHTFVIGISDDVSSWHLQQMANAGAGLDVAPPPDPNFYNTCPKDPAVTPKYGMPAQNARFYKPADATELAQSLATILNGTRTCSFKLHGKVTAGKESLGRVVLDGVPLGYQAPDGWHLLDDQTLEVLGASCDRIKTTSMLLEVTFPCDSVTIIR